MHLNGGALVDRKQVAAYLGVSPKTVWTMTRKRGLPHIRLGGLIKYRIESVDKYITEMGKNSKRK
jgi:excisionase family DNA binding protein